jgi:hypothetical protein
LATGGGIKLADGTVSINNGGQRLDANGNRRYHRNPERERSFSDGFFEIPPVLRAGAKTDLNYEIEHKWPDGRVIKSSDKGSMTVKSQETIKAPAGEFLAWRVETDVFWQWPDGSRGRTTSVGWYVPELRTYVIREFDSRNANGSLGDRTRTELTSFSVRGAENLAQR